MDIRKLGLVAACLALPVSALNHGIRAAPARATSEAELAEKSINGISPAPTARPEIAEMELFRRADYSLPPGYCGWYGDYNSISYTCAMRSASCINVGDYRGCCNGPSLSCASTFFSACIPSRSLTESQSCGKSTICCSNTNYPECGTILFSSSANTLRTYTNIDCYSAGFGSTYAMQDYPPFWTDTSSSPSITSSSISTTTTPSPPPTETTSPPPPPTQTPDPPSPTPIGAIVGGAVGGFAVLALIGLGIFLVMRRSRRDSHQPPVGPSSAGGAQPPPAFPTQQQMAQTQLSPPTSPGVPPAYDPRYNYANAATPPHQAGVYGQQMGPDPNAGGVGVFGHPSPPLQSPGSPDPVKTAGGPGTSPMQFQQHEVMSEAPATNPPGMGNNRVELA